MQQLSGAVHTKGESPQDGFRDVQTCRTTLALAYVLKKNKSLYK